MDVILGRWYRIFWIVYFRNFHINLCLINKKFNWIFRKALIQLNRPIINNSKKKISRKKVGKLNRIRRNKGKKIREKIRKKHRRIKQRNKKNLRLWSDCKRQIVSIILLIKYGNVFVILLKNVTNMIYLKIIQNLNYSSFNLLKIQFLGYFLLLIIIL